MGLFGKKEEVSDDAQTAAAAGGDTKKCAICGEEKSTSEGKLMLEGTAFRCNDCEEKAEGGDDHGETCEFC